jgi:hypothetical protein
MVPAEDNNDFDIIFHYKYSVLVYIVVGEEHQQRRKTVEVTEGKFSLPIK